MRDLIRDIIITTIAVVAGIFMGSELRDTAEIKSDQLILNNAIKAIKQKQTGERNEMFFSEIEQLRQTVKNNGLQLESSIRSLFQDREKENNHENNYTQYTEVINKRIDSILFLCSSGIPEESDKTEKYSEILYNRSDTLETGSTNCFVISGHVGQPVKIARSTDTEIRRAYSIDKEGKLIVQNETVPTEFLCLNPVEAFAITSNKGGNRSVYIETQHKTDTINSFFIQRPVRYTIDSITIIPCSKKNDISFAIHFMPEVTGDLKANIKINLLVNSQVKEISEEISVPEGTSEYKKTMSYPFGRSPYSFKVNDIELEIIENPEGTEYIKSHSYDNY